MPFIFIVTLYVFLTIYAIVRAIGPGAGENAVAIVVGFVLITSVFAVLLGRDDPLRRSIDHAEEAAREDLIFRCPSTHSSVLTGVFAPRAPGR